MTNQTYKPICRSDELILGTGSSIIITGWTPKERVAKLLEPHEYACIGNLYSSMYGLTPLVVNLLANPYNWDIHLLSATNQDKVAKAVEAFYYFLRGHYYLDDKYYVTRGKEGEVIGSLHKAIEVTALRKAVDSLATRLWEPVTKVEDLIKSVKSAERWKYPLQQFAEPIMIEIPKPESTTLPGDLSGHLVKGQTVAEVWLKAIHLIRSTGRLTTSQYGERQELIQLTSVVSAEPPEFYFEPWLPVTADFMKEYLPSIITGELSEGVAYTYGSKIRAFKWFDHLKSQIITIDQIEEVANKLKAHSDSSQGTISLWDIATDTYSKNPPCLTNIWVRLIDKKLIIIATFRSHDVYTAYPSNVLALRRLQDVLLKYLDESYSVGELIINSQSAHIYGHSFQHTDDVLKECYKSKVDYSDPVGNFEIRIIKKFAEQILITQMTPAGEPVRTYCGDNPLKLVREIATANPGIQPAHLGYLGIELQKASEEGQYYKQDF